VAVALAGQSREVGALSRYPVPRPSEQPERAIEQEGVSSVEHRPVDAARTERRATARVQLITDRPILESRASGGRRSPRELDDVLSSSTWRS